MFHEPGSRLRSWLERAARTDPETRDRLTSELARIRPAYDAAERERARLAGIEHECAERLMLIERLDGERSRLESRASCLESEVKTLESEVKTLEAEVAAVRASWSWRLTGPLRAAARLLREARSGR